MAIETNDQIKELDNRAHELTVEILDGHEGVEFPRSFETTFHVHTLDSFLVAETSYWFGVAEGLFTAWFLDKFDQMPTKEQNIFRREYPSPLGPEIKEKAEERARMKWNNYQEKPHKP